MFESILNWRFLRPVEPKVGNANQLELLRPLDGPAKILRLGGCSGRVFDGNADVTSYEYSQDLLPRINARHLAVQGNFDLVILEDRTFRGASHIEVLRTLRENGYKGPIIAEVSELWRDSCVLSCYRRVLKTPMSMVPEFKDEDVYRNVILLPTGREFDLRVPRDARHQLITQLLSEGHVDGKSFFVRERQRVYPKPPHDLKAQVVNRTFLESDVNFGQLTAEEFILRLFGMENEAVTDGALALLDLGSIRPDFMRDLLVQNPKLRRACGRAVVVDLYHTKRLDSESPQCLTAEDVEVLAMDICKDPSYFGRFNLVSINAPNSDYDYAIRYVDESVALCAKGGIVLVRFHRDDELHHLHFYKQQFKSWGFELAKVITEVPRNFPDTQYIHGVPSRGLGGSDTNIFLFMQTPAIQTSG